MDIRWQTQQCRHNGSGNSSYHQKSMVATHPRGLIASDIPCPLASLFDQRSRFAAAWGRILIRVFPCAPWDISVTQKVFFLGDTRGRRGGGVKLPGGGGEALVYLLSSFFVHMIAGTRISDMRRILAHMHFSVQCCIGFNLNCGRHHCRALLLQICSAGKVFSSSENVVPLPLISSILVHE